MPSLALVCLIIFSSFTIVFSQPVIVPPSYYTVTSPNVLCNMTMAMPSLKQIQPISWNCSAAKSLATTIGPAVWCQWTGIVCGSNRLSITSLNLDRKSLNGYIPSVLGYLTSLKFLSLPINSLTGTIPSFLGNLKSLQILDLRNNTLSGTVPSSLTTITALRIFNVNFNYLSGTLADHFKQNTLNSDDDTINSSFDQIDKPTGQPTHQPSSSPTATPCTLLIF